MPRYAEHCGWIQTVINWTVGWVLIVLPLEQASRKLMNDPEVSSPVYQIQQPKKLYQ